MGYAPQKWGRTPKRGRCQIEKSKVPKQGDGEEIPRYKWCRRPRNTAGQRAPERISTETQKAKVTLNMVEQIWPQRKVHRWLFYRPRLLQGMGWFLKHEHFQENKKSSKNYIMGINSWLKTTVILGSVVSSIYSHNNENLKCRFVQNLRCNFVGKIK